MGGCKPLRTGPMIANSLADLKLTTRHNPGRNAAVPAHDVVTARPQQLFHARTGVAQAGTFEQHRAYVKLPILER